MTQILRIALSKPGNILSLTLGAIVLGILVAVPAMMTSHSTASAPTSTQLGVALYQAGLDPEALAAAGVQAAQVPTFIAEADTVLTNRLDQLILAQQDHAQAQRQVQQLRRAIRAGVAEEGAVAALATAESNAATAQATLDSIEDELFAVATNHLESNQISLLGTIQSNRRWHLPIQYAVRDRTEPEWVALRNALANVRISNQAGEEPDPASSALVAGENSRPDVAQAAVYLDTRLSAIQAAFNSTVGD